MTLLPALLLLLTDIALSAKTDAVFAALKPGQPGAAVLVLKNGDVQFRKGFGVANVEHGIPVTPQTVFELASVSKQFTAFATLLLVDQGKLKLDDDVRQHIPELPEFDAKRPIRVDDLLHHTSGLPDYLKTVLTGGYKGRYSTLRNRDVPKLIADKKLEFPTGTKWSYSNTNYALLALLIEKLSGQSFGKFLKAEVFDPLGMTASTVLEDADQVIPKKAYGYSNTKLRGLLTHNPEIVISGDGGVHTSLEDFAKWDAALRNKKLLKSATWPLVFTPGKLDSGKKHPYAAGWMVGPGFANHSGAWAGYRCIVSRHFASGYTFAVLTNDANAPVLKWLEQLEELYLPAKDEKK